MAASELGDDTVALYRVDDRTRRLVRNGALEPGPAVNGLCLHQSRTSGVLSVFLGGGHQGEVEQWQLLPVGGRVSARRVRRFAVGSDVQGCVADDALGHLYVGDERGVWKYGAEPSAGAMRTLVDSTGANGHLTADVQGLAIAHGPNGSGVLLASSRGSNTFTAYRREGDNDFVSTLRVGGAGGIDDVEGIGGIHVTTAPLGSRFPNGLFVVKDGMNGDQNQNFKLVPWRPLP